MQDEPGVWWGPQELQQGQLIRWHISGLSLWLLRDEREWKVAWQWPEEWADSPEVERWDDPPYPDEEDLPVERYVFANTREPIQLWPVTADRSVIVTPRVPFFLGPHEATRLFVLSPLWLRLRSANGTTLRELPIRRPSDTFFGPSTLEGELCYSNRSRASLDLDHHEHFPRRAVTSVHIRNESNTALPVDRFKIPVTMLSIFASGNRLFTESLNVTVDQGELASVSVRPGPPEEAVGGTLLSDPRERIGETGHLMRVFDELVSFSRRI